MEIAILALGCFWGPEVKFSKLDGILKTEVGYCGGNSSETNYKEVCTGSTNHAEVVKLEFDPELISYEKIIKFFMKYMILKHSTHKDLILEPNIEVKFFMQMNSKNKSQKK